LKLENSGKIFTQKIKREKM